VIVRASNELDNAWFSKLTSYIPGPSFRGVIAVDGDTRMGMIGLDRWTPNSVQAHIAIVDPKCLARLKREVVEYIRQHGRRLVYGVTPSDNERALSLIKALGFREITRLKDAWSDGVDFVITEYVIHEQRQSSAA